MRNVNILLVSSKYSPEYSGSGYRAHNLYKRLMASHSELSVTVLCGSETENSNEKYQFEGFHVQRIACKPFPEMSTNGLLRRIQLSFNCHSETRKTKEVLDQYTDGPDLIHVFGKNNITLSALAFAAENGIPALIELCNEMDTPFHYIPFPVKLWYSPGLPERYRFICISDRLRQVCLNHNIKEQDIWCRPNPVEESRFTSVKEDKKFQLRRELTKFSPEDKVIVCIAKFMKRKNHVFLLDVIKKLSDEFKLFLGGPLVEKGPLYENNKGIYDQIVRRIEDENLGHRVEIQHGFYKDIERYYQLADVFAFPTTAEGLGTPMLESIACGTPVVANIIPGITDYWIKDGENGYLSELNPEKFADQIRNAVALPEESRTRESLKIIENAGTKTIDATYYSLICEFTATDSENIKS